MQGWKMKIVSFIYEYKGNDWFTQTIKEMLDNFEKEIRAEVVDECIEELYEVTPQTIDQKLDMVFVDALKQLKEQSNENNTSN